MVVWKCPVCEKETEQEELHCAHCGAPNPSAPKPSEPEEPSKTAESSVMAVPYYRRRFLRVLSYLSLAGIMTTVLWGAVIGGDALADEWLDFMSHGIAVMICVVVALFLASVMIALTVYTIGHSEMRAGPIFWHMWIIRDKTIPSEGYSDTVRLFYIVTLLNLGLIFGLGMAPTNFALVALIYPAFIYMGVLFGSMFSVASDLRKPSRLLGTVLTPIGWFLGVLDVTVLDVAGIWISFLGIGVGAPLALGSILSRKSSK